MPQPTCGYILKNDYVDYIGGPDAELVAAHTYDAAEYLMKVHKGDGTELDTDFGGEVPDVGRPTTRPVTCGRRTSASRAATS